MSSSLDISPARRRLTEMEVANLLSVSPRTLQQWRSRGEGPPFLKLGHRSVRYDEAAVEAWVESRCRLNTADIQSLR